MFNLPRASLNIPFPTKQHREQRASFKTIRNKEKESNEASIPRLIHLLDKQDVYMMNDIHMNYPFCLENKVNGSFFFN